MNTLRELCQPRASAFDTARRDTAFDLGARRGGEKGNVHWLRPEFQAPGTAERNKARARTPEQEVLIGEEAPAATADGVQPVWPKDLANRMVAVRSVLQRGRTMT